jgi:anaphase-promoting complex subunit 10
MASSQPQQAPSPVLTYSNRREIGGEAVWSLSSAKPGNGVQQIRDDNVDTYWQSDGGQPHLINVIFNKKVSLMEVAFYLDYNLDESYTPKRMSVRAGNTAHDLEEVRAVDLNEPMGWVSIPLYALDDNGEQTTLRAFYLQICVVSMHQNGRDTHIRQAKVFGPRSSLNSASG